MNESDKREYNRREFFRGVGRGLALGGLALVSAILVAMRRKAPRQQKCINSGVCRGCPTFDGCGLPQALSAKRVLGR